MLYSQGVPLEDLGVPRADGGRSKPSARLWRLFAEHYRLFAGTPTRLWLTTPSKRCSARREALRRQRRSSLRCHRRASEAGFRPRALFERFEIEVLATTVISLLRFALASYLPIRLARARDHHLSTRSRRRPGSPVFRRERRPLGAITSEDTGVVEGLPPRARKAPRVFRYDMGRPRPITATPAATSDLAPPSAAALSRRSPGRRPSGG